jgi:uncharacterized membrane protein YtjA (UPF0391 family)
MEIAAAKAYKQERIAAALSHGTPSKTLGSGPKNLNGKSQEVVMLGWALGFFIVALIAAVFGFSGIALAAAGIAKILFFVFLVLFLVSLVGHLLRRT